MDDKSDAELDNLLSGISTENCDTPEERQYTTLFSGLSDSFWLPPSEDHHGNTPWLPRNQTQTSQSRTTEVGKYLPGSTPIHGDSKTTQTDKSMSTTSQTQGYIIHCMNTNRYIRIFGEEILKSEIKTEPLLIVNQELSGSTHDKNKNSLHGNHPCPMCHKNFNAEWKLTRHKRDAHSNLKFKCELKDCHSQYPTKDSLDRHYRIKHGLTSQEISEIHKKMLE